MKNAIKLFGIIALVAVIGFFIVACSNGSTSSPPPMPPAPPASPFPKPQNGMWWVNGGANMVYFHGSDFIQRYEMSSGYKGTIAFNENTGIFTLTVTDEWNGTSWDPNSNIVEGSYSVSGNTLTVTNCDDPAFDNDYIYYPVPSDGSVTTKPQDAAYSNGGGKTLTISSSGAAWSDGTYSGTCIFDTTEVPGFFYNKETGFSSGCGPWYTKNSGAVLVIPYHNWGNTNLQGTWTK